jgi:hypothetical protein
MEYKEIPGYSKYGISESGEVKDLETGKIKKPILHISGRLRIGLRSDEGKGKSLKIHQLVAMAYLGHEPCGHERVVDHIDNNPLNNHVSNLQIISHRENASKDTWRKNPSSQYIGVIWAKPSQKWRASIRINGKSKHLGYFTTELEAHEFYQLALNNIDRYQDNKQFRELIKLLLIESMVFDNLV